jgi:GPH family glycoside/pentoside/hexuronide:cation symporter
MTTEADVAPARTPLATLLAFGTPGLPLAGIVLVFGVYLPRFYVGLGNDFLAVAGAIALVRFIDIWLDPFLGIAMDRTRTPVGRYRPWLLAGAPITMLGVYELLNPPAGAGPTHLVIWMLVAYAGVSMLNLSLAAWASVLSGRYHERSRVYGVTQGLAVVGAVGLMLLPVFTHGALVLGKAASMPGVGWIIVVAIPVAAVICAGLTPERIAPSGPRTGFSWRDLAKVASQPSMLRIVVADLMLTLGPGTTAPLYVYFFHDAKGFNIAEVGFLLIFYIGAGLVGAPFWGRLARRFGKHRTVQVACLAYAVSQTILMILPRVYPGHHLVEMLPTVGGMFAVGFCASAFLLLIRAMVADVVDEARLATGKDFTSLLFSLVTTTTKIGTVITVVIVFPILKAVGYNGKEGAVNTPHAIFGLEMCYLFAPILLVFVGGAMFFGYKLDAVRHAQIRAELEARDVETTIATAIA